MAEYMSEERGTGRHQNHKRCSAIRAEPKRLFWTNATFESSSKMRSFRNMVRRFITGSLRKPSANEIRPGPEAQRRSRNSRKLPLTGGVSAGRGDVIFVWPPIFRFGPTS